MILCILLNVILPDFQLIVTHLAEQLQRATYTGTMEESVDEHDGGARERLPLQEVNDERENMRLKVEHLDFRNDENKTPLHLAAKRGNME